jgi:hypothetical protein
VFYLDQAKKCEFKGTDFVKIINNGITDDNLSQILLVMGILFDKSYEKYLINLYLVYYLFTAYHKYLYRKKGFYFDLNFFKEQYSLKNFENFLKFSPDNNEKEYYETKKIVDQFLKRMIYYKFIVNNILNPEKINNIDIYSELELKKYENLSFYDMIFGIEKELDFEDKRLPHFFKPIKDNYNLIQDCIKKFNSNIHLNEFDKKQITSKLLIYGVKPEYNFVKLPENMIDFTAKYQNLPCSNCKKIGIKSLICLSCGTKICDSDNCLMQTLGLAFNSMYVHASICGGGNCIYLSTSPGDIFFVQGTNFIEKHLYGYLDKFKEPVKEGEITSDYVLQPNIVENAKKMFINYSYRKLFNLK